MSGALNRLGKLDIFPNLYLFITPIWKGVQPRRQASCEVWRICVSIRCQSADAGSIICTPASSGPDDDGSNQAEQRQKIGSHKTGTREEENNPIENGDASG